MTDRNAPKVNIALCQMKVVTGRPDLNFATMERMAKEAKAQKAHVAAFPEMAIMGYMVGDAWTDDHFCRTAISFNAKVQALSKELDMTIIYGNVYLEERLNEDGGYHPNRDGRMRRYNAAYIYTKGEPAKRCYPNIPDSYIYAGVQPKTNHPTYRVFDDDRYFSSIVDICLDNGVYRLDQYYIPFKIEVDGQQVLIGVELCEDLWCEDYRYLLKPISPAVMLINNGADYIVNISSSPWTFGKNKARDNRNIEVKKDLATQSSHPFVPMLYVNKVGAENNNKNTIVYDGGSTAYGYDGKPVAFMRSDFQEELFVFYMPYDAERKGIDRPSSNHVDDEINAISAGIMHIQEKMGLSNPPNVILGISGGVDSAVIATLFVMRYGKEKTYLLNLPTNNNTSKTIVNAQHVAKVTGAHYMQRSITPIVDAVTDFLKAFAAEHGFDWNDPRLDVLKENIQSKIRGTDIITNCAAIIGGVPINCGNKTENAFGYFTLYGDSIGALSPLGDCLKDRVFPIARRLNEIWAAEHNGEIVIPENLLPNEDGDCEIPPSAELKPGQRDPMNPYHDKVLAAYMDFRKKRAEDIMQWWLDGTLHTNLGMPLWWTEKYDLVNAEAFLSDLMTLNNKFFGMSYKRNQLPDNVMLTKSAFGYDYREVQMPYFKSDNFKRLYNAVIAKKVYIPIA